MKLVKPWKDLNPNGYHGRMNTPPALNIEIPNPPINRAIQDFCPYCEDPLVKVCVEYIKIKILLFAFIVAEKLSKISFC